MFLLDLNGSMTYRAFATLLYITTLFSTKSKDFSPARPDPPELRGVVNLTIDAGNGRSEQYEFTAISGLAFDSLGQIFVSDASTHDVRIFNALGGYLYKIGQKGAGPSDFLMPRNIAFSPSGQLWIDDGGNHRFCIYELGAPAGKFVKSVPFLSNRFALEHLHWDPMGNVVGVDLAPSRNPADPPRLVRSFLDKNGSVFGRDTAPPVAADSTESWVLRGKGSVATYSKPFGAMRLYAFGGYGLAAYATNTRYAVQVVDSKGKQLALIERKLTPVGLSAQDNDFVDMLLQRVAAQARQPPASLGLARPKVKPVVAAIRFDLDGRLWVEHSVPGGQVHRADIYSATGTWTATMTWPANVSLNNGAVKGNSGLGVQTDAEGVQRPVRLTWR